MAKSPEKNLKEPEMAYILREVTRALSYLHGHHRIHRDVKGTNILFTKEGEYTFFKNCFYDWILNNLTCTNFKLKIFFR